jgi:hypothetical protein
MQPSYGKIQGEIEMKKKKPNSISKLMSTCVLILLATAWITACAPVASKQALDRTSSQSVSGGIAPAAPSMAEVSNAVSDNAFSVGVEASQPARLVIKNANLTIVVADPGKSLDAISQMADEMGGFVVTANLSHSQMSSGAEVPHGSITIRIPAEKLNDAIARIEAESNQPPQNKNIESQDVTSDYIDLQSRLKNLEDAEQQLRKIMDNAFSTDDVLSVYNRLVQVREEIEVLKGKIQYYEEAASLSAISVNLVANAAVQPLKIGNWQPVGVMKEAVQTLLNTLKFLANALIWIVILIFPVLLILYLVFVLPLTLVLRSWRKRRAARKARQQEQESQVNTPLK